MAYEQAAESAAPGRQAHSHGATAAAGVAALAVADRPDGRGGAVLLPARDTCQHPGQPELLPVHLGRQRSQIKTVTFANSSSGSNTTVSGTLTNGKSFTTVIPGSPTTALSQQLSADGVKTVNATPP